MSNVHQSLKETFAELEQAKKIDRHLVQVQEQLTAAEKNLDALSAQLQREFKDIEKLEKLSVKGLFHKVLGSKEEQIEKERQEYLQVSLKYDEAKKSAELLAYEQDLLVKKVQNLPQLEAKLNSLIALRAKALISENTAVGRQVLDMHRVIDAQHQFVQVVGGVQQTGKEVIMILEKMIAHLQKAKNWGQWDMSGRHRSASYMKHASIDHAKDLSYNAQHMLARFQRDLEQIYGGARLNFNLQMESFSRFTDIFFDNLISDWIVQRKIQNALNNVLNVRDQIVRILQSLSAEITKAEEKATSLEQQRKQIIIES